MPDFVVKYRRGSSSSARHLSGDAPGQIYRQARSYGSIINMMIEAIESNGVVIWEDRKWKTTSAEYKRVFGM
jgi:hypothetical protein